MFSFKYSHNHIGCYWKVSLIYVTYFILVSSVLYIPFSFLFMCDLFVFQVLTPYHLSKKGLVLLSNLLQVLIT